MQKNYLVPFGALIFGLLSLSNTGCAPVKANSGQLEVPSETLIEDPNSRPAAACYPGVTQAVCYNTLELSKLPEQTALYKYPNPYTDPSFPQSFNKTQYLPPDRLLDLRLISVNQLLAPHFVRSEIMQDGASRGYYGLFSVATLDRLEKLRSTLNKPMLITSGYRSPGHNAKLAGSAKWSRHTYGDAVDFKVAGTSYKTLAEQCLKHGASFYQLYTDHIHCDWRGLNSDKAFYPHQDETQNITAAAVQNEGRILARVMVQEAELPSLVLETLVPKEDEGELLHEWQVMDQGGAVQTSQESLFRLAAVPGTYQILVRVGGSVVLQREITIP
ncbi:MAG: D-Ala-D-Ala carboxypeptidase family metallohydrolase [Bdellovibrionales bacterium]